MEELFSGFGTVIPQFKVVQTHGNGRPHLEKEKNHVEGATAQIEKGVRRTSGRRKREADPRENRTVFVGNLPPTITRRKLKQLFSQSWKVESVRLRSMIVEKGKLPVKVAKRKQLQITSSTINAYVVFIEEDDANKARALNGVLVGDRHIRVDLVTGENEHEHGRCVFVGGLPYSVDEEEVREVFTRYGDVESVRVVRERKTGTGKGFGFVTFQDQSGVMFALQQRGIEMKGQKLRVMKSKDMTKVQNFDSASAKFSGVQANKTRKSEKIQRGKNSVNLKKSGVATKKVSQSKISKESQVKNEGDTKKSVLRSGERPSRLFHKKKEARQRERVEIKKKRTPVQKKKEEDMTKRRRAAKLGQNNKHKFNNKTNISPTVHQ